MEVSQLFKQTPHPKDMNDLYHCFNLSNSLNVIYWWKFFEMIENIDGDIIECGVGRGRSLITLLSINTYLGKVSKKFPKKIFALDSFEGFPLPHSYDQSKRNPKKGEWSESPNKQFKYNINNLKKILLLAGFKNFDQTGLEIVKGFFDKTCNTIDTKKISILHLDGDLYESTIKPLQILSDKIQIGGIVVIDDYIADEKKSKMEKFPGARKAINEFLSANKNFSLHVSIRGTPYLIKNK